jgi:putative intracellular protease/amidase
MKDTGFMVKICFGRLMLAVKGWSSMPYDPMPLKMVYISQGRVDWFTPMGSPGIVEIGQQLAAARAATGASPNAADLVRQLEISWQAIANVLDLWTAARHARVSRSGAGRSGRAPDRAAFV